MTTATAFAQRSCAKAFCAGLAGAAFALLAASSALAQNAPAAGTIAEGSLKDKTLTFVSYGWSNIVLTMFLSVILVNIGRERERVIGSRATDPTTGS